MNIKPAVVARAPQSRGMSASLRRLAARRVAGAFAIGGLLAGSLHSASAATFNYTGGTGTTGAPVSGTFSTGFTPTISNDGTTSATTTADTLSFGGATGGASYTATDDLTTTININALSFSNIAGIVATLARGTNTGANNSITLGGTTPKVTTGAGAVVNNLDLILAAATTFNIGTGGFTQNGAVSNTASANGFTKSGSGRLTLAGVNNFAAGTTITFLAGGMGTNDGSILLTNNNALGTNAITINGTNAVGNGGAGVIAGVELSGGVTIGSNVTITTGGRAALTTNAALRNLSGNNTFAGTLQQTNAGGGGVVTLADANGTLTLSGTINQTVANSTRGFAYLGSGTALITGTMADNGTAIQNISLGSTASPFSGTVILDGIQTYSGGTTINSGTLQVGNGDAKGGLGAAPLTVGTNANNVTDNGALVFNRTDTPTFANAISGSGTVTQKGTGTVTLAGANTYTGATNITAGTLALTGSLGATAITATNGTFNARPGSGSQSAASLTLNAGSGFSMADLGLGTFNLTGTGTDLTFGTATGTAPIFTFDIGNLANGTTATDQLLAAGAASSVGNGGTITISRLAGTTTLTAGDYNLITAASGLGMNLSLNTMSLIVGTTVGTG